jgi:hypothetical protein
MGKYSSESCLLSEASSSPCGLGMIGVPGPGGPLEPGGP